MFDARSHSACTFDHELKVLLLDQGGAVIAAGQPAAAAQAAPVFVYGSLLSGLHNHHRLG